MVAAGSLVGPAPLVWDTAEVGAPTSGRGRPSGTVTFLFTDVEGSTRLWATDFDAMSASLLVHDTIVRVTIESHNGYVFSRAGDAFAAAFGRASDAVRAATAAQHELHAATWPGPALKVRMGLHLGEAEERDDDYFGPAVNIAARVEAAGHGGQVLITEAVRLAVPMRPSQAVDLGTHRLRDVGEPLRLFQLGDATFPRLRGVGPDRSHLPVRATRLLGRDDDVVAVRSLLQQSRLVTVVAAGGLGKTRLAIAVGEEELESRSGGVWFVDLSAAKAESEVSSVIANALGVRAGRADIVRQVAAYLADQDALVVLDNCEHVIETSGRFCEDLLTHRGTASVLATSREALGVEGEQLFRLEPLRSDSPDSPAVQLFLDRARSADSRYAATDADARILAAICARLDGMPLAIELAAARVIVMSPAELLEGLGDRFALLSPRRPTRHRRTLAATLDWSYDLLDEEHQRVFRSIGAFVGGFDVHALAAATTSSSSRALTFAEALRQVAPRSRGYRPRSQVPSARDHQGLRGVPPRRRRRDERGPHATSRPFSPPRDRARPCALRFH